MRNNEAEHNKITNLIVFWIARIYVVSFAQPS